MLFSYGKCMDGEVLRVSLERVSGWCKDMGQPVTAYKCPKGNSGGTAEFIRPERNAFGAFLF